jgi:glycosyltransferase involved in cell wall biosynthesis
MVARGAWATGGDAGNWVSERRKSFSAAAQGRDLMKIGRREWSPKLIPARAEALSDRAAPRPQYHGRIRVLVLIPSLNVGGAEIDLVRILPKIDRELFKVTVCTFLERGELGKALQDQGIEVIGPLSVSLHAWHRILRRFAHRISSHLKSAFRSLWPLSSLSQAVFYLLDLLRLARPIATLLQRMARILHAVLYVSEIARLARPISTYMRTSEVDVVHTVLPVSYLVGACASILAERRPVLMSRLSLNLYQQEHRLIGLIERWILHRSVDAVIGNANAVLQELRSEGIHEKKLHLIYNGIDASAFTKEMVDRSTARRTLSIPNGALVFSVIANLHPYKGHEDLMRALGIFTQIVQIDWCCLVVGKDVHERLPELTNLCCESGLSGNIKFLGPQQNIPIILSACDIHLSASHQEGFPNNILEAMCARLPVVATAVGGVPELVVDGQTGYLVPPQDTDRMAGALAALVQAPIQRKAFGEAGYARVVSHFAIDNNVTEFESLYSSLAGSPCLRAQPIRQSRFSVAGP